MKKIVTNDDLINRLPKDQADQLRAEIAEEVAKIRGGARAGAGRKPLKETAKNRTVRLKDSEYEKFLEIGGSAWLREMLKEVS